MRLKELFEKFGFVGLKVKTPILELDWRPTDPDKNAAWDLYVELLTRTATQKTNDNHGTELSALESIYEIFPLTRSTLKTYGRMAENFTKIAVIILNQVIRPFTSKWHRLSKMGTFKNQTKCKLFRRELSHLQDKLKSYAKLLSELAEVEDMTELENAND